MHPTHSHAVDSLGMVTLVVADQKAALDWYQDALGFEVGTDETFEMGEATSRWLTVRPADSAGPEISLVAVDDPMYDDRDQLTLDDRMGSHTLWLFHTDDLDAAVDAFAEADVDMDDLQETPWGRMLNFRDPDGNGFQLFEQPADAS